MTHKIALALTELDERRQVYLNNEPINRREGNIKQANLERKISDGLKMIRDKVK